MLGSLTKYLRFMGYDTKSAVSMTLGNSREDTLLLDIAKKESRYLLTRDRELAKRGGELSFYLESDDVLCQVEALFLAGLIKNPARFGMQRCIVCNTKLRSATPEEIKCTPYAPFGKGKGDFMWCPLCRKIYWSGTHSENMEKRIKKIFEK